MKDDISKRVSLIEVEHNTLRAELLQNKQYVFERPLLIVTAAGVAAVQLSGNPSVLLLPLLLIVLLLINLWFTVNRLKSIARISAYIEIILERAQHKWIGWENSLRSHRMWTKRHNKQEQNEALSKHIKQDAIPDAMMFYGPLYLLHVVTVIVALAVSWLSLVSSSGYPTIVSFVLTLFAAILFIGYCLGPYHPKKMRDLIEVQRAIWIVSLNIDENDLNTEPLRSTDL